MFLFHISDIHYGADPVIGQEKLHKIIDSVNSQAVKPDVVLVTGDLTWKWSYKEYEPCFKALDRLAAPYLVITGNQDKSADLIKALKAYCPRHPHPETSDCLQYVVDDYPVRIIAVDTYKENVGNGGFDKERQQWLIKKLEDNPHKKPVVIMVHQFTLPSGSGFFDAHPGDWYESFNRIVAAHQDTVKLVVCGHLHNSLASQIGNTPIISGFSTNWSEPLLNARLKTPEHDYIRPSAYHIHHYENGRFTSCVVTVPGTNVTKR